MFFFIAARRTVLAYSVVVVVACMHQLHTHRSRRMQTGAEGKGIEIQPTPGPEDPGGNFFRRLMAYITDDDDV